MPLVLADQPQHYPGPPSFCILPKFYLGWVRSGAYTFDIWVLKPALPLWAPHIYVWRGPGFGWHEETARVTTREPGNLGEALQTAHDFVRDNWWQILSW